MLWVYAMQGLLHEAPLFCSSRATGCHGAIAHFNPTRAGFLTSQKFTGDVASLRVLREGKELDLCIKSVGLPSLPCQAYPPCLAFVGAQRGVPGCLWCWHMAQPCRPEVVLTKALFHHRLMRPDFLVPHHLFNKDPSYFVVAGLVFTNLTGGGHGRGVGVRHQPQHAARRGKLVRLGCLPDPCPLPRTNLLQSRTWHPSLGPTTCGKPPSNSWTGCCTLTRIDQGSRSSC